MPSPVNAIMNNPTDSRNGSQSRFPATARQMPSANAAVMKGTGQRNRKFGSENQRCVMKGCANGVQRLTMAMKDSVAAKLHGARRLAKSCVFASVLKISQAAPSNE